MAYSSSSCLPPLSCHTRKVAINYPRHESDNNNIDEEYGYHFPVMALKSIPSLSQHHGQCCRNATAKEIINK